MKFKVEKGDMTKMETLVKLKSLATEIQKPIKVMEKQRGEINDYIQRLEKEKELLEGSEGENIIEQIIGIDIKLDSSKRMLKEVLPSRHTLTKSNKFYEEYNQLYIDYVREFQKDIAPDIQKINKHSDEIQKLLGKVQKTENHRYRELCNVVSSITSYVDPTFIGDFQNSVRRMERIYQFNVVSDELKHWRGQLDK
ncbi:hypothetical protein CN941_18415 [Bacillus cereus]|uniref:hypothetical protein n=1 Tax=Bacillus wiedmannii TaxID=1890302 RepID=UPI000BF9102B|nr:hypothetical protein [Bacillus wiedmannii]PGA80831.1 hypothetical protein COL94_25385 [Bacillus wiedmannii]PGM39151.1 hypothetical protein CN941_18415 [Bacillus cereus]